MRCPTLAELPPPPAGKTGWPWTVETPQAPSVPHAGRAWPKVSIVTASFSHGAFIEETIRSVLLQGYPDLEYIIIDGGSKDDSVSIIRKYEKWLGYWVSEPDEGPCQATNKGFAVATGELLGMMCADDLFMPGGVLTLVQLSLAKPESVAWVGGCPQIDLAGTLVGNTLPFVRERSEIGDWDFGGWFYSVACLFRADLFRSLGRLDERFANASDVELWIRLAKAGSFSLTDETVATVRLNPQSLARRDRPAELSGMIAANFINGHYEVAKRILVRYGEDIAASPPASNPHADRRLSSIGVGTLTSHLVRRVAGGVKRRVYRLIRRKRD